MQIDLDMVIEVLGKDLKRVVGPTKCLITRPSPIGESATTSSITFCNKEGKEALEMITATQAAVILCGDEPLLVEVQDSTKTLLMVENPRLSFLRLVAKLFFTPSTSPGIHPAAVVDPQAKIHPSVYVGPFAYVGNCEIDEQTVIHGHVHIYSGNIKIGKNVVIHAGTVIGVDGFGYERNDSGELEFFPSVGGVVIEDNVEIHSNVNVDCGTLGNTIIGRGTKIDKFCHIGHNVKIGKHCVITAQGMIGGGAQIGDYSWIAPSVCIRDGGIKIGSHVFVGMASVVTKDVPDHAEVMGAPSRPVSEYKLLLESFRQLVKRTE